MPKKRMLVFPKEQKVLTDFGERLRLARLRRQISAETMAKRAACSRMTLQKAELGSPSVAFGTYMRILAALHMIDDINLLARDDLVGRRLQDLELPKRRVVKKKDNPMPSESTTTSDRDGNLLNGASEPE